MTQGMKVNFSESQMYQMSLTDKDIKLKETKYAMVTTTPSTQ